MKPTKSSITRKLDKVCSEIVRSHGQCMKCGLGDYDKLQCAHIYSRTYRSVRWDLDNLLCLCASCHFYAHKNPLIFAEFVRNHLGEVKYQSLKFRAIALKKWALSDMIDYYNSLKELQESQHTHSQQLRAI